MFDIAIELGDQLVIHPVGYIRKNLLTINEDVEIFIIDFGGAGETFGSEQDITALLGTNEWECGDSVIDTGVLYRLIA